ncbi:SAM-dependent methyltransferase [Leptolyngbya sp. 7M]|uniref:SAM-dependent methyltransferase n=1 Tax=Leptolyngbya sp. 7M TaxID=2812896 RepID=UPI001B8B28EC|nr:SAM-dependent methyltransferase [Leptolyngbya sp. 7M]QYO64639.1 SAM-dependent methyltransferase [Leptolyngbya sp. 7M]
MATQPLATDSNPALCQLIAQQIAASPEQRITFAEFMELALYQPQYGYYATNRGQAGIQRDFFTSPHLGSDFGELLAEQFADLWHQLDCPNPFILVEMGAGQGLLVQDIVRYLHRHQFECFAALEYWMIEKSPALIAAQQQRLRSLIDSWGNSMKPPKHFVRHCGWMKTLRIPNIPMA